MNTIFWVLCGYCIGERLFELFLSARNRRRMKSQHFTQQEPLGPLRLMIALHTGWLVATILEAIFMPTAIPAALSLVAAIAFILAQALRVWTLRTLGKHWNISVMTSPEDTPSFVSTGPYRFIRHPNYLVVIVEIVSLPIIGGAWLSAIFFSALNGIVLHKRIATEEHALFAIPGYAAVMGAKPRFLP